MEGGVAAELVPLVSNGIDVFYGAFTSDDNNTNLLFVDKCSIEKGSVEGVPFEVNTIKCHNSSPETFLVNNDMNLTASCILVDFATGETKASIFTSPFFWTFLFQDQLDRNIQPVNTIVKYEANTCTGIAYKAFQLEEHLVEFSTANIDPTKGTIATSGKEKLDRMKVWPENPFYEYQCNKQSSHFVISKKHKNVTCAAAGCDSWSNTKCGHNICKKCCVKIQTKGCKLPA